MSKATTVSVRLTEQELWELSNIFGAGYEPGAEGNEVADRVSSKLRDASQKLKGGALLRTRTGTPLDN